MDITPYLVDWVRLQAEWKSDGQEPFWGEIADGEGQWVRHPNTDVGESDYVNSEIGEGFWAIADRLEPDQTKALGDFLSAFALNLREEDEEEEFETPLEIERVNNLYVASALSPATVERFLELLDVIPIERVVAFADEVIEESGSDLESGQEYQKFINSWAGVLREAKALGFGLVVTVS